MIQWCHGDIVIFKMKTIISVLRIYYIQRNKLCDHAFYHEMQHLKINKTSYSKSASYLQKSKKNFKKSIFLFLVNKFWICKRVGLWLSPFYS